MLKDTNWLDWKIVENVAKLLDKICPEASLPPRNCTDSKEIGSKLSELLCNTQSEEHLKLMQVIILYC